MGMTSLPKGYRAIVIGASGGIGSAIHRALASDENCGEVIGLSRSGTGMGTLLRSPPAGPYWSCPVPDRILPATGCPASARRCPRSRG